MIKSYYVVKKDGKYQQVQMDTHYENTELKELFVIKDVFQALDIADLTDGKVFELKIEERSIELLEEKGEK